MQTSAAQWDIRNLINEYVDIVKKDNPLTLARAGGKHEFYDIKAKYQ